MAIDISSNKPQTDAPPPRSRLQQLRELQIGTPKVSTSDRIFFTEQLALLLETGNALHPSLEALEEQCGSLTLKKVVGEIKEDVLAGTPFSVALAKHPSVFNSTYVSVVAAAEQGGFMHRVLDQLRDTDERAEKLRGIMISSLSYPIFLVFFSIAVLIIVMVFVFPKFADMFNAIIDELPVTTVILLRCSEIITAHWPYLIAAGAAVFLLGYFVIRSPAGTLWLDRGKLSAPLLRQLYLELYMVNLMRVLGLSLHNGVQLIEALGAGAGAVRNNALQQALFQVIERVKEGATVAKAFASINYFPPMILQMIATGERTGNLARVMNRLADNYERQLSKRLITLSKLAEPIMLLFMGGLVATIVISLILPIFKLSRVVH